MFSYFLFTDILTSVEYILLDQRNITIPNSKDQDIFTGFITFQPSNGGIETPKTSKGTLSSTENQNRQLHQIISVLQNIYFIKYFPNYWRLDQPRSIISFLKGSGGDAGVLNLP